MRPLQAHCHLGLGTLYLKTDRPKPAHAELTTAIALYRAMDMTLWIPQAEAALAQVQEGMQEETRGVSMDFYTVLDQVLALLRQRGRVSYRASSASSTWTTTPWRICRKNSSTPTTRWPTKTAGAWSGLVRLEAQPRHPPPDEPAASAPRPPEAERRQLTVLFCDLVDSTRLSRQLDPEDYREVVRAYQAAAAEVVQRFDGYIAQYLGDGLLVYFGYPQAHEDDAQRAGRAGLEMVQGIASLNTRLTRDRGLRLAVRVGIHTGAVVVGAIGGAGRQEQLALGDTPNLAARLQGLAAPNTVVVSATTLGSSRAFLPARPWGRTPSKGWRSPCSCTSSWRRVGHRRGWTPWRPMV